ncbi:rhodanese-like domain-containing protein [Kineosporia mesophila]|uniref:Rhodanese-like domain-containing protein n=1 Tax=Kineosporia mesophila TaxID=566012 RepID=A0ABP6ZIZ8_9ACTN|nr:hypothetical protein [Kineosporia mesophila]
MSSLVAVSWLAGHLEEVVLLDASIRRTETGYVSGLPEYEAGHLPGARFADVFEQFSDPEAGFAFGAPTKQQLEDAARSVGITGDTTVVVYDRLSGAWAARLWWVFRSFGIERVFVLDGGLSAWTAAGLELVTGPDQGPGQPGDVTAVPQEGFFVGLSEVQALSENPSADDPVVCALRESEYDKGYIPNSSSLPYPSLLAPDGTVDLDRARRAAQGYDTADQVVLYCGGAINAAGLALALTEGGLPIGRITLYDGSLSEWKSDPARPLTTSQS